MRNSSVLKSIILVSGLIALGVGISLLFMPVALYASVNIDVAGKVSLLSDLRATGGALLASGVLIMSGAFLSYLRFTSVVISCVLYLAYGISRIIAMTIDGMPADILIYIAVVEITIGLLNLFALLKYREP